MLKIKVYYEDTDSGGVVYHANYLKYFERVRTKLFSNKKIDLVSYHNRGVIFAVRSVFADYLRPARYGDELIVTTDITCLKKVSIEFSHVIKRGEEILVTGTAKLVAINEQFKPIRIPDDILIKLSD